MIRTKECGKCKRELPINMFNKHNTNKDGFKWECKDCAFRYNRLSKWNVPFEVEKKFIRPCKKCGNWITESEIEDNGGICDICCYEKEATDEWRFLNEH